MNIAPRHIKKLFTAASQLNSPGERQAFLDRECVGNPELLARLLQLLEAHAAPASVLERPLAATVEPETDLFPPLPDEISEATATPDSIAATSSIEAKPDDPAVGTAVYRSASPAGVVIAGKYKLIEEIGEGGMGSVWMAKQLEPVRRAVAVKLIKAGMDSRQVLARFEAERQALALMDHPNIARVLDGGLHEGKPFFVMELVKGVPITQFCDERKLTPRQRLELFVPVCQAIQHAHQKGIIHRDIKPNNVLVALYDDRPVPKVIDFGVAKAAGEALTDRTLMTGFGVIVGTPEYMSPEQAGLNQLDIDTRSDVYSLGVLLYELLTGSPPHPRRELEKAGIMEILRVICEVDVPRPSSRLSTSQKLAGIAAMRSTEPSRLMRLIRGELDWLVMKALEKDRVRRYDSVNAFASDVQRYLAGEAVQAVPPSAMYRLSKFARRNRGPLLAAGVIFAALVSGVFGTSVGLSRALEERREADTARGKAEENEVKSRQSEAQAVEAEKGLLKARDELWANLYASRAAQIQTAWSASQYSRVRELLAAQIPTAQRSDLRGFEWHYLDRQINADIRTITLPKTLPSAPPISPDGSQVLRFFQDGNGAVLKAYDTHTGREQFSLPHSPENLGSIAYSTDGKWILTTLKGRNPVVFGDGQTRRWNASTGKEDVDCRQTANPHTWPLAGDGGLPVLFSRLSPIGKPFVYYIWDGKELKTVTTPLNTPAELCGISPDSAVVAVYMQRDRDKKAILLFLDARTGLPLKDSSEITFAWSIDYPHRLPVRFSRDGRFAAISTPRSWFVYQISPWRKIAEAKGGYDEVPLLALSPDGARLAIVSGMDAKIMDLASGQFWRVLKGHDGGIANVAFSGDGSKLITAGGDRIKYWEANLDDRGQITLDHEKTKNGIHSPDSITPDGSRLVHAYIGGVRVWDRDGKLLSTYPPEINGVPISERDTEIKPPGKFRTKGLGVRFHMGMAAISADGRRVAWWFRVADVTGPRERYASVLELVDPDAGHSLLSVNRVGNITNAIFSPDGRTLAAVIESPSEVKVWDAETGKERFTFTPPPGKDFVPAFSTDGSCLGIIGTDEKSLAVAQWELSNGRAVPCERVQFGQEWGRSDFNMYPAALGPGGKRAALPLMAAAGPGSRTAVVRVWDCETGSHPVDLRFLGPTLPNFLVFSPDGRRLATANVLSNTSEVQIWDPETGDLLLSLPQEGCVRTLAFTPNSQSLQVVVRVGNEFEAKLLNGTPRSEPNR